MATVVIVICVSILVFIIALGVYRIRSAYQLNSKENEGSKENEMDWDDSALTITVNPMEVSSKMYLLIIYSIYTLLPIIADSGQLTKTKTSIIYNEQFNTI